jgi:hypothetical protein
MIFTHRHHRRAGPLESHPFFREAFPDFEWTEVVVGEDGTSRRRRRNSSSSNSSNSSSAIEQVEESGGMRGAKRQDSDKDSDDSDQDLTKRNSHETLRTIHMRRRPERVSEAEMAAFQSRLHGAEGGTHMDPATATETTGGVAAGLALVLVAVPSKAEERRGSLSAETGT